MNFKLSLWKKSHAVSLSKAFRKATFIALRSIRPFRDSRSYWDERYAAGGNSGAGAYDRSALFKARVLNDFVRTHHVQSVMEHGCGDGHQLSMAEYPLYIGFDVSNHALALCRRAFANDPSKRFFHSDEYAAEQSELTLSLDVIYHLIEDDVFERYMERLCDSALQFVIIYSSDTDKQDAPQSPHVRHRRFSAWMKEHRPAWRLIKHLPNEFPLERYPDEGSFSEFFIYAH
jgi:hypothetical protein